jgi:hypothetical protein
MEKIFFRSINDVLGQASKLREIFEGGGKILLSDISCFVVAVLPFSKNAVKETFDLLQEFSGGNYNIAPYIVISEELFLPRFVFATEYEKVIFELLKNSGVNAVLLLKPTFQFPHFVLKNRKIGVKFPDAETKNVLRVLGGVALCFPAIKNGVPVSNPELVDFVDVVIQIKNFSPARLPTYIEVIENYVVKVVSEGFLSKNEFHEKLAPLGFRVV